MLYLSHANFSGHVILIHVYHVAGKFGGGKSLADLLFSNMWQKCLADEYICQPKG